MLDSESVRVLPKCALCDRPAWAWLLDRTAEPAFEAALCSDHAPNGAASYTMVSLAAVRRMLEDRP